MNEFDHRPDPVLGEWLRETLSAPDDAAFVQRVLAAAPHVPPAESWWDVLNQWARPGIAAAAVIGFTLGVWVARQRVVEPVATAEELLVAAGETVSAGTLLASRSLPELDPDLMLQPVDQ